MALVESQQSRPRRGTELLLLLPAVGLGIAAVWIISMQLLGEFPAKAWQYVGLLVVLAGAFHLVVRRFAPYADPVLLPMAVALNGIGIAMIYRLDLASSATGNNGVKQVVNTAVALIVAMAVLIVLRDHRKLRKYTYTAMVAALVLLTLPFTPIGKTVYGATIWIEIAGYSFQPAELAKLFLSVFFAGYLVRNRDTLSLAGPKVLGVQLPRMRDLAPIAVVWMVAVAVLVFQRDLGTSLLFFGLFVVMLYLATQRTSWILLGMVMFAVAAVLAYYTQPHVRSRIHGWLHAMDPEVYDAVGGSYQMVQGMFGMANGGLMGTGWGQGRPDLVPLAESDFIIAALGEEIGLTGLLAILTIYLVIVQRGMRIALGVRDGFGKLLAGGLSFVMALQVFIVVGGITRLIPITGLTTPFLAAGGSSLLANWILIALLLRLSNAARSPGQPASRSEQRGRGGSAENVQVVTA